MKKIINRIWILAFFILTATSVVNAQKIFIKKGIWQASIQRSDSNNIYFNFIVESKNNKQSLYIINADEKLLVDDIKPYKDSLLITLPFFSASLRVKAENENVLKGVYIKGYGDRKFETPFIAAWGIKQRYHSYAKPKYNISGTWDVLFAGRKNTATKAVGNFIQTPDGKITGSFLTPTGDYRFLEGVVSADTVRLSGFDGGFASLFTAIIKNDSTIEVAYFYSGAVAHDKWTATKNANAKLPDEFGYSHLRSGETRLNFSFKDTDGKIVSVKDNNYKNKVIVIQILGSWCPNCMDETAFLSEYYNKNKNRGVEIIGLAYERSDNFNESQKALEPFRKRFNVQYPFLITGVTPSDPQRVEKTLPEIDRISAFPTTLFIDKKGTVRKIHTGYNGPGTGKFYDEFIQEFDKIINDLLAEQ
ncbi:MAG TPA: TlpA disulfide reductase family protein [Chitinophagaceae bacterium]|nr:TlpA disulfide reductase family protein [Chitinophagaceae bacterium]